MYYKDEVPTSGIITLRSVFKVKNYVFQPLKMRNGMNYPFVKAVRTVNGQSEMIMTDKERESEESMYFIPEDLMIDVTDGTTFNLANPLERNKWIAIRESETIVPTRDARDENGNFIIDGDKAKYGRAELWVDIPGEESEKAVSRRKLITRAWTFIENDSAEGRLTKVKLLGKGMRNAPQSDVADYLYIKAEKDPNLIIELYTSSDLALKLLIIDAKEKGVIWQDKGLWSYADTALGATDDAVILFFKQSQNKRVLDSIKLETYPDMVREIEEPKKGKGKDEQN